MKRPVAMALFLAAILLAAFALGRCSAQKQAPCTEHAGGVQYACPDSAP